MLLLAYTIGFAHNVIPHCHHALGEMEQAHDHSEAHHVHEHQDHQHEEHEEVDHAHISHKDHLDSGLLDLILCVLSETDHPATNHGHEFYQNTANSAVKLDSATNLKLSALALLVFTDPSCDLEPVSFGTDPPRIYSPPYLSNSPHRGPPVFSC